MTKDDLLEALRQRFIIISDGGGDSSIEVASRECLRHILWAWDCGRLRSSAELTTAPDDWEPPR